MTVTVATPDLILGQELADNQVALVSDTRPWSRSRVEPFRR
jgi:hypothetical protein